MVDFQSPTSENKRGRKKRRKKETTAAKYNGLPYWAAIINSNMTTDTNSSTMKHKRMLETSE